MKRQQIVTAACLMFSTPALAGASCSDHIKWAGPGCGSRPSAEIEQTTVCNANAAAGPVSPELAFYTINGTSVYSRLLAGTVQCGSSCPDTTVHSVLVACLPEDVLRVGSNKVNLKIFWQGGGTFTGTLSSVSRIVAGGKVIPINECTFTKNAGDSKQFACNPTLNLSLKDISPNDYAEIEALKAELIKLQNELASLGILETEIVTLKEFIDHLLRLPLEELEPPEIAAIAADVAATKADMDKVVAADQKQKKDALEASQTAAVQVDELADKLAGKTGMIPALPPGKDHSIEGTWQEITVTASGGTLVLPDFKATVAEFETKLKLLAAAGKIDEIVALFHAIEAFVTEWGVKIVQLKVVAPDIVKHFDGFIASVLAIQKSVFLDSYTPTPILKKQWLTSTEHQYLQEFDRKLGKANSEVLVRSLNEVPDNITPQQKTFARNGLATLFFWLAVKAFVPDTLNNVQNVEQTLVQGLSRSFFKIARKTADWLPVSSNLTSLCSCVAGTKCDGNEQALGTLERSLNCATSVTFPGVTTGLKQLGTLGKKLHEAAASIPVVRQSKFLQDLAKDVADNYFDDQSAQLVKKIADPDDKLFDELAPRARHATMLYLLIGPDNDDGTFAKNLIKMNTLRRKSGFVYDPDHKAFTPQLADYLLIGPGAPVGSGPLDQKQKMLVRRLIEDRIRDDQTLLVLHEESGLERHIFFDLKKFVFYCFNKDDVFYGMQKLALGLPGAEAKICPLP
jgi:hypothetical protein